MLGSDHRRFAKRRYRNPEIRHPGHIHRMLRTIDDRSDRSDAWPAAGATDCREIVDDPRLSAPRRSSLATAGSRPRLCSADNSGRPLVLGAISRAARGVQNADRADLEQRAWRDLDDDRDDRAVAIALGWARERSDVARGDGQADLTDRDRHGGVVVARAPKSVRITGPKSLMARRASASPSGGASLRSL